MTIRRPLMAWNSAQEEDEYLEEPVLVDGVDEDPGTCPPGMVGEEGRQDVQCHKDDDTQPADPVQDIGQHRAFPLISQAFHEANIPFKTHLRLLNHYVSFTGYDHRDGQGNLPASEEISCPSSPKMHRDDVRDPSAGTPLLPLCGSAQRHKDFNIVYYPILVSIDKSDNTHGLFVPDILLGMDKSSL